MQALDNRVELLTEQYDGTVVRLHQLKVQIKRATRRLQAAEIHLAYEQSVLANLMVARYKGLDSTTLDIVLGASSLDQVTGSLDIQQRFDAAVTDAVDQIQIARDAIKAQRVQLIATRVQVLAQKRLIAKRRDKITLMLRHRRRLMHSLGSQVRIGEAADSIGQAHVALEAAGVGAPGHEAEPGRSGRRGPRPGGARRARPDRRALRVGRRVAPDRV